MGVTKNLLLVEDSDNDIFLFRRALARSELRPNVYTAKDGADAIAMLQHLSPFEDAKLYPEPDVIVTDLKMPGLDGFHLLAWLQENAERLQIPTVVFSNCCSSEDMRTAFRLGASAFIAKPSSLDNLTRALRVLLGYWEGCGLGQMEESGGVKRPVATPEKA